LDYLVSIENNTYHLWQLELLIESFKLQKLEDRLVVAIAETKEPVIGNFTHNVKKHERAFIHHNYGRNKKCSYLNKTYAIITALKEGVIKTPFAVIEPDMILLKPLVENKSDVNFSYDWRISQNMLQFHGYNINSHLPKLLAKRGLMLGTLWPKIGGVISFNKNVPTEFFTRIMNWSEAIQEARNDKSHTRYLDKAGWVLAFIDYNNVLTTQRNLDYECGMTEQNPNAHFLHYSQGMPPLFSKKMFKYKPPYIMLSGIDPYDLFLKHNPTHATNELQKVVKAYEKTIENKKMIQDI